MTPRPMNELLVVLAAGVAAGGVAVTGFGGIV